MTVPAASPAASIPRGGGSGRARRSRLPAGLAGVGFAAVMAASVLIDGGRPDTFATDRQVTAFLQGHANQMRGAVAAFLLIPAAFSSQSCL